MTLITHSYYMAIRQLRALIRQPWYVAFTLVQPIIWLVLYGQLFKRVVELPGFNASSYVSFLTPGVIVMSALFAGGWNGMSIIGRSIAACWTASWFLR
jgi:ABC-2 type transport system permease protein